MDEEALRKKEKIKLLLAGYYGQGSEASTTPEGSAHSISRQSVPVAAGPAEAPAFDAGQLLRGSTLERLMIEHRSTAKEIKNLDSDMQSLVYENYNKFIHATDTIRTMKGQLDTTAPELDKLKAIMGGYIIVADCCCCWTGVSGSMQACAHTHIVHGQPTAQPPLPHRHCGGPQHGC